ncbi:MAG: acyl carrier protein [Candidatus Margulisiibacteriota bacterium]
MKSKNAETLRQIFADTLKVDVSLIKDSLSYNTPEQGIQWDSLSHMTLVASIEKQYNILLETEDIIDMSSFLKAQEILTKYGISFD